ncbi:unnamed protein product [Ranitomeya imitator]|uniref:Uncharacterized protein n=1 Tax=Ranitomeya imitator TaxID=111125 RepID=A0ABN9LAE7_9NEOB|nr:unnamed protein product [Ranitomeya imitator]
MSGPFLTRYMSQCWMDLLFLVLDNGSFQLRAGWAGAGPQMQLRSVVARSRGGPRSLSRVGNDIPSLEPLRWLLRTPFDRNLPVES